MNSKPFAALKAILGEYKTEEGKGTPFTAEYSGDKEPSDGKSSTQELKSWKKMKGTGKEETNWDKDVDQGSPVLTDKKEDRTPLPELYKKKKKHSDRLAIKQVLSAVGEDVIPEGSVINTMEGEDIVDIVTQLDDASIMRLYSFIHTGQGDQGLIMSPKANPQQIRNDILRNITEYEPEIREAMAIGIVEPLHLAASVVTDGKKLLKVGSVAQILNDMETPTHKFVAKGTVGVIDAVDESGYIGWLKGEDGKHYGWFDSEFLKVGEQLKVKKPEPTIAPGLVSKNLELGNDANGETAKITLTFNDMDAGLQFFNSVGGQNVSGGGQQPQTPQGPQVPQIGGPQTTPPPPAGGEEENAPPPTEVA